MNLVIGASVTVAWYFDDETTPLTEAVLDRVSQAGAIVPTLWRLEVAMPFNQPFGGNASPPGIAISHWPS